MGVKELGHAVLYVEDPDGDELEVNIVPASTWSRDPAMVLAPPRPLRL